MYRQFCLAQLEQLVQVGLGILNMRIASVMQSLCILCTCASQQQQLA